MKRTPIEWLGDDVMHRVLYCNLDDTDLWKARMVSKEFLRVINESHSILRRRYSIGKFFRHSALLTAMVPHKGMWRAARDEGPGRQYNLINIYYNRSQLAALMKVAKQDVDEVLRDPIANSNQFHHLTVYDVCIVDDDDVLCRFIDRNVPIINFLLRNVEIPRVQRVELTSIPCKSYIMTPISTYRHMLYVCSRLKNEKPIAHFLELHDKYFAFRFRTPFQDQFFEECRDATREYPPLYNLAIRQR